MSSLSLPLRCFTSYQGLVPCAAAHGIPWLRTGALRVRTRSQARSPARLSWLLNSCFSPPGQGPVLHTGTLSLFGVRHPGMLLVSPLTNNQRGLCISQRLLANSGVLWDPKSCSPGMGEGARGWRKRGAAG